MSGSGSGGVFADFHRDIPHVAVFSDILVKALRIPQFVGGGAELGARGTELKAAGSE